MDHFYGYLPEEYEELNLTIGRGDKIERIVMMMDQ